jgi:hypothetical protein
MVEMKKLFQERFKCSVRKSDTSDYQPIIRKMGSPASGGGTWFHEDVAIEYAKWLYDEF